MANQSFQSVPPNIEDPVVLRRFLAKLLEQLDIAFGNRAQQEAFSSEKEFQQTVSKLENKFNEALSKLERTITETGNDSAEYTDETATNIEGLSLVNLLTKSRATVDSFPSGLIMMWSGTLGTIPDGFVLCDGSNGTPDLQDKFIIGAGSTYNVGDTGGKDKYNSGELTTNSASSGVTLNTTTTTCTTGSETVISNVTLNELGHSHSLPEFSILPPYYALAYIMKV